MVTQYTGPPLSNVHLAAICEIGASIDRVAESIGVTLIEDRDDLDKFRAALLRLSTGEIFSIYQRPNFNSFMIQIPAGNDKFLGILANILSELGLQENEVVAIYLDYFKLNQLCHESPSSNFLNQSN